jgi:hypothetical protein
MNQFLLVGVLHGLGDLTEQCQPLLHTQPGPVLLYEVIQPNGIRIVLKDECRAALVVFVLKRTEQTGVVNPFQDLELAPSGSPDRLPVGRRGTQWNGVEADATLDALKRHVGAS